MSVFVQETIRLIKCFMVRQHHTFQKIKSIPESMSFTLDIKRATLN